MWTHAGASLYRIAIGFGSALVVAVLMGLASFLWRSARIAVADVVTVLNSTSVFVWIVVSLIWFGLTNMAPIFTTFMITLPVVAANVVEGVASVDRRLLEMGQVYRLSGWEKFRSIVIPSTIPHLVAGMKVGFGLALKVSVVAEIFGVTSGIGYIMNYSREILATQMVFVVGPRHGRHHARDRQARLRLADAPARALALSPPARRRSKAPRGSTGTVR